MYVISIASVRARDTGLIVHHVIPQNNITIIVEYFGGGGGGYGFVRPRTMNYRIKVYFGT